MNLGGGEILSLFYIKVHVNIIESQALRFHLRN